MLAELVYLNYRRTGEEFYEIEKWNKLPNGTDEDCAFEDGATVGWHA